MSNRTTSTTKSLTILALTLPALMASAHVAAIQVLSATVKDERIADATVILQKNGEQSSMKTTDAQGRVDFGPGISEDPEALMIIRKPGYSDLVTKCPCRGLTYAISPVMTNLDGMRIVLNWGADPSDLDSHLVYPGNHVYFSRKQGEQAMLDVDDTTSFGPETITIEKKVDGERYVYAVHDYSNRGRSNSYHLSNSNAKVFVYVGQTLIRSYYVPKNQPGNLWTVFAVTEGGEFQDYDTIKGVTSHERLNTSEFQGVMDGQQVRRVSYSDDASRRAKRLNDQGVSAYHNGQLDVAIELYRQAIDLDGNFGQAYSNLGLAYQKVGRVAEALWANRKAIALAHGASANTTRAGTHYNNGRIYENAGQWNDALREYRYAKQERDRDVYDRAIARMLEKGAH